ncbi:transcriptional regulator [Haloarcula montana]|uniref:transcriptional regulator n=1 Tax=Haloarcula montana TaxID=3111776 RepID=UPI002D76B55B|nr:transcriptional regulator [Haloarcula sp. GH36]
MIYGQSSDIYSMAGGREETITDTEILRVFDETEDPALFTGEVADEIGFSNQGTLPRLRALNDEGLIATKKSGRVPMWWITDLGREFLSEDR